MLCHLIWVDRRQNDVGPIASWHRYQDVVSGGGDYILSQLGMCNKGNDSSLRLQ
jgi:hypothetical protein